MTTHRKIDQQSVVSVLLLTLVLNIAVAVGKIALGAITGALAITADGVHSLTDSAGNVAGLVAVRVSNNPPDDDHPYGHTKFETVAALLIGILLFITAWEVVTGALNRLGGSEKPEINVLSLVVLVFTLFVNIGVSRYQIREGNRLKSAILLADAQNTSSDVFVTLSVLVSSILVAITGWAWLDLVAAMIVVALIVRAGWGIVRQTGNILVDTAPYTPAEIVPYVEEITAVQSVVRVRSRGTTEAAYIDVDVRVAADTTVRETDKITDIIRTKLNEHLDGIEEIEVHFVANHI